MPFIATTNRLLFAWFSALGLERTSSGDVKQRGPIDPHLVAAVGAAIAAELLPASERQRIGIGDIWAFPNVAAFGASSIEAFENDGAATYAELSERSLEYFEALRAVTMTETEVDDAANPT